MTIKAILRDGAIQPVEPLPPGWTEGQELVVEDSRVYDADAEMSQWSQEMDATTAQIPTEEHDRFLRALDEIERESKEAVRRQWERP